MNRAPLTPNIQENPTGYAVEKVKDFIVVIESLQGREEVLPALQRRLGSLALEAKKLANDFSPGKPPYDIPGRNGEKQSS